MLVVWFSFSVSLLVFYVRVLSPEKRILNSWATIVDFTYLFFQFYQLWVLIFWSSFVHKHLGLLRILVIWYIYHCHLSQWHYVMSHFIPGNFSCSVYFDINQSSFLLINVCKESFLILLLFFSPLCCMSCRILVSQPGIEPMLPAPWLSPVLTTGLPGESVFCLFWSSYCWWKFN